VSGEKVVARAEFQGETLEKLTHSAIEAFFRFSGLAEARSFNGRYVVLVGEASGTHHEQRSGADVVLVSVTTWKAECWLIAREESK
jgi:hypothetical protein